MGWGYGRLVADKPERKDQESTSTNGGELLTIPTKEYASAFAFLESLYGLAGRSEPHNLPWTKKEFHNRLTHISRLND